jgi:hypothetical protein
MDVAEVSVWCLNSVDKTIWQWKYGDELSDHLQMVVALFVRTLLKLCPHCSLKVDGFRERFS